MKVFLGGTCNNSTWRDELIPELEIDYFNPVVDDWKPEDQERELEERENSDFVLYVLTPLMSGVYSIAEVVDDSNKRPDKTLFCVLDKDEDEDGKILQWTKDQKKSLEAVKKMVTENCAIVLENLDEVAYFLNSAE